MATRRPFHCRQGISEEITLETSGVGWDLGSTCIQRRIKILNEDTTSIVKIAVSKEGSYSDQRSTTVYLLPDYLDTIGHSVAEVQRETMLYRILQCGRRNAVRISMAGRYAKSGYQRDRFFGPAILPSNTASPI